MGREKRGGREGRAPEFAPSVFRLWRHGSTSEGKEAEKGEEGMLLAVACTISQPFSGSEEKKKRS